MTLLSKSLTLLAASSLALIGVAAQQAPAQKPGVDTRGGRPRDFELKLDYRITAAGNSGINYRSAVVADAVTPNTRFAMRGYQFDIDLLNGRVMSVTMDDDQAGPPLDGLIGVQVHVGPPMKVEYRNLRLKNG
ncbi:MAG: family 16 glycoside hydrolase [Vicinamibacterales bacterium]